MYVTEPPPPILPPPVIHHDTWSLRAKEIFADQHNLPSATATMNPNSFTVNSGVGVGQTQGCNLHPFHLPDDINHDSSSDDESSSSDDFL